MLIRKHDECVIFLYNYEELLYNYDVEVSNKETNDGIVAESWCNFFNICLEKFVFQFSFVIQNQEYKNEVFFIVQLT